MNTYSEAAVVPPPLPLSNPSVQRRKISSPNVSSLPAFPPSLLGNHDANGCIPPEKANHQIMHDSWDGITLSEAQILGRQNDKEGVYADYILTLRRVCLMSP